MGNVTNWQQHIMPKLLERPGKELAEILGEELPADAMPSRRYDGGRVFVPTVRTHLMAGEDLRLKAIVLASNPPKEAALYWRPMGKGEYKKVVLNREHIARGLYSAVLPATIIKDTDFEYYLNVSWATGKDIYLPATAPRISQTVVVTEP
jgi:hypothetical protein